MSQWGDTIVLVDKVWTSEFWTRITMTNSPLDDNQKNGLLLF